MAVLLAPPLAFGIFILVGLGLYRLGDLIAPPFTRTPGKVETYACGEDLTNQRAPFTYDAFFRVALFFTVMEVAALVITTIPAGGYAWGALIFLCVVSISVATLTFKYD